MDRKDDAVRPELNRRFANDGVEAPPLLLHSRVHGQEQPDIVAARVEMARERAGDVRKPPGFGEWRGFGGDDENVHGGGDDTVRR